MDGTGRVHRERVADQAAAERRIEEIGSLIRPGEWRGTRSGPASSGSDDHPVGERPLIDKLVAGTGWQVSGSAALCFAGLGVYYLLTRLWVLAAISVLGAGISMLRPAHVREVDERLELQEAA